jgi:hypothetical protein
MTAPDDLGQWETDGGPPAPAPPMVPDRMPDTRVPPIMGDVIDQANVIRLECTGSREAPSWVAILGPRDGGLRVAAPTPKQALEAMALVAETCGWVWDEGWREKR